MIPCLLDGAYHNHKAPFLILLSDFLSIFSLFALSARSLCLLPLFASSA